MASAPPAPGLAGRPQRKRNLFLFKALHASLQLGTGPLWDRHHVCFAARPSLSPPNRVGQHIGNAASIDPTVRRVGTTANPTEVSRFPPEVVMVKQLVFENDAREAVLRGVAKLAKA
ncbi:MAG: hypothetical protein JNL12_07365, partial [Planctomycetes bacterium]|nr:hypothetical protein [Planctomycetota bacterium]